MHNQNIRRRKKENKVEEIFVLIMTQNFQKLMPETIPQIQAAHIQEYRNCRLSSRKTWEKNLQGTSGSSYKKLRSCHFTLTISKKLNKLKNQQVLVRSLKEVRSQGKPLPPNLQTDSEYRESQPTAAESHKQKTWQEPAPG